MNPAMRHRCLALAGVFQAAELVQQVARQGRADPPALAATLGSLFKTRAENAEAVYGGGSDLRTGLQALRAQLAGQRTALSLEATRYAVTLLHLERRLFRRRELLDALRTGIERISAQAEYFSPTHDTVVAALADLYSRTVSTITPRIIVHGEPDYLGDQARAGLIRALLLAGIRAAVLWRQSGGSRWRLVFSRRPLLLAADALLADMPGSAA